jgi:hypothetical protein
MTAHAPLRVLVVDDNADTRANLCDILELDNYTVETAGSLAEMLQRNNWADFAAIILDRLLPDGKADDVLPRLRELAPHADVIIVTGHSDLQGAIAALRQGAADYILKPINTETLRAALARAVERRRLKIEKARSEEAFRTLVEAAPCMIVILRPDHSIAYFSPFAEEVTGRRAADVLGKDYFALFLPPESHAANAAEAQRILAGHPTHGYENQVLRQDGTRRWIVWNAHSLPDYEGGPAILGVGQDITKLKLAQEKALQSERLAAIGQMVTGLAHESGNALARSQACLEMLALEVEDRPEAADLIARIQKAQDHLRHLYEEVRSYAAPLKLERETWDLAGIWWQAWSNLAMLRQGRDATLTEQTDGVDLECSVDQFRLEQVFRNVLENSLAACHDPTRIEVQARAATLDGRPAVRLAIRDNGPGLSAEQKQRIFEPFYTTKTKGTGLGMAIAKRIVEAHGGQMAIGNSTAPGAEIVITLPREHS